MGATCMTCGAPVNANGRKYCDAHNRFKGAAHRRDVNYLVEENQRLRRKLATLEAEQVPHP